MPEQPRELLGTADIGRRYGVSGETVAQWRKRFRDVHPFPVPDVEVTSGGGGKIAGWSPERLPEIDSWKREHAEWVSQRKSAGGQHRYSRMYRPSPPNTLPTS